ncbi:hypothetical protein F4859DRAFT_77890 [Xylaria cf. heliscus]|nr:hypothetical protein F4859DRAFT_77890 [Xylaria cf. heliscus]
MLGDSASMHDCVNNDGDRSCHYNVGRTMLSVVKSTTVQQPVSSDLMSKRHSSLQNAGKPSLTPRPPRPRTLEPSPTISAPNPENTRESGQRYHTSLRSCASGSSPSTSSTPLHTSTSPRGSLNAPRRRTCGKGKNKKRQQNGSGSGDESEPANRSLKKKMCDNSSPTPRLACPFFRRCPRKHHACGLNSFEKISYVVQHLMRTHFKGVNCDCPICGEGFETISSRNEHIRERLCPKRDLELKDITAEKLEEIRISNNKPKSQYNKWVDIYKILFGDSTSLPQPWYTDPRECLLNDFINYYVSQSGNHGTFNTIGASGRNEDPEALRDRMSQTVRNYLTDEQSVLELTSPILELSLPNSISQDLSALSSTFDVTESPSTIFPQLQCVTTPNPVSTIPASQESHLRNPVGIADEPHGQGRYYGVELNTILYDDQDFYAEFVNDF